MTGIGEAESTMVAEPRLAASVILVRDVPLPASPGGSAGPESAGRPISKDAVSDLEVFVQHRVSTMDFAAGMVVFPGGRVDHADSSGWNFTDDVVEQHAAAWHRSSIAVEPASARHNAGRVLAAAQREVFEEAGLKLDAATLRPWANWVTPEDQPKRFDTYFYLACPAPGPSHSTRRQRRRRRCGCRSGESLRPRPREPSSSCRPLWFCLMNCSLSAPWRLCWLKSGTLCRCIRTREPCRSSSGSGANRHPLLRSPAEVGLGWG